MPARLLLDDDCRQACGARIALIQIAGPPELVGIGIGTWSFLPRSRTSFSPFSRDEAPRGNRRSPQGARAPRTSAPRSARLHPILELRVPVAPALRCVVEKMIDGAQEIEAALLDVLGKPRVSRVEVAQCT